jgi:hypothetical protein
MGIHLNGNKIFFELEDDTLRSMMLYYTGRSKTKKPVLDIPKCILYGLFRPFEFLEKIMSNYLSVNESPASSEFVLKINLSDNKYRTFKGLTTNGDGYHYSAHLVTKPEDFPWDLIYKITPPK